jgi:5-formyltetrahydrofolate cyclo-ligase
MGSEININPLLTWLLQEQITVVTPKTLRNRELQHLELNSLEELESGIFGTSHPANSVEYTGNYDLIIVPGLAFDANKYRLGYGGGYYDTFLAENPVAFTVGIGYPFQQLKEIPKEAHDACLDLVV